MTEKTEKEIKVIEEICTLLDSLPDTDARIRVLDYLWELYGNSNGLQQSLDEALNTGDGTYRP